MPSVRDLEVNDPNVLLQRITSAFPEIRWSTYKFVNHGWDHEVIILDDQLVFRFPAATEYLAELQNEIRLLDYLNEKIHFRIPRYTYVAPDTSFAGYNIIPGEELSEITFRQLSDDERAVIADQLATFLTQLHTIRVDEVQQFRVNRANIVADTEKLKQLAEQYLKQSLTSQEYAAAIQTLNELNAMGGTSYQPTLTHNDISPKHIIWDGNAQQIGIIDFSDRAISDPAYDFTELYLYGKQFVEQVYQTYTGPKDETFLTRAVTYLKRVGVSSLVNSYLTDKITYQEAKALFDVAVSLDAK